MVYEIASEKTLAMTGWVVFCQLRICSVSSFGYYKYGSREVFGFWQAGPGYDRNIASKDDLFEKIHYMHRNSVRRGLILNPQEWKWSSAGWYAGEREVVLAVDKMNL
ncbi:MAG: hypothetical protein JETT_1973 [Candidatus Jettenia ecosi]|uniref:Uncharacterized protein n=1 Tax=Candidatus Jettenia ecosi TaxID=2494326 RepID=A0A533QAL9_9BACT|nr:MAG: hypothetical protein JETT_1973 [Candidatus Jettenia ecosi]